MNQCGLQGESRIGSIPSFSKPTKFGFKIILCDTKVSYKKNYELYFGKKY